MIEASRACYFIMFIPIKLSKAPSTDNDPHKFVNWPFFASLAGKTPP